MKQTREILKHLRKKYEAIDYYYSIIDNIEINQEKNPDMSIESCKALIEGISKFMLRSLEGDSYDSSGVDKLDLHPLIKKSLSKISENNDCFEEDFVNRSCSLIHLMGEIRNKRGDISHGKLSPKEVISDSLFSKLVMQMTDGFLFYTLSHFAKIEILHKRELKFEDNIEFNQWLDEVNTFNNLSYSKALFDQDRTAYEQELFDFIDKKEKNKS